MDLLLLEKTLLGLFIAVIVAITISKLRGKRFKLPPGPIPVPVFGNWLQVGDDLNHRNLTDLAKKFGDIFLLRMGQRNWWWSRPLTSPRRSSTPRASNSGRGHETSCSIFSPGRARIWCSRSTVSTGGR
ncbi:hypothetical protein Prudu_015711 [Prunus dulcis]|uniref:Trans-cinnamate 4-monooxygenase n=1 Tax=Prunus dulcis TaxID=3755 RepID=A0A4Y1RJM1_PRUDU|nr:hypothetical protein Prudu_015711 [Prunus dulcis]